MKKITIFSIVLTIFSQIQTSMPDMRAIKRREEMQKRMLANANLQTQEGRELVQRTKERQAESLQAAHNFADKIVASSQKKNSKTVQRIPVESIQAMNDTDLKNKTANLLNGKVVKDKKELAQVLRKANATL